MKKLFTIFLLFAMLFTMAACGESETGGGPHDAGHGIYGEKGDAPMEDGGADFDAAVPEGGGEPGGNSNLQSGTLTAGEWSDVKNKDFWTSILNREEWSTLATTRRIRATQWVTVKIVDKDGNPCFNVPVELHNNDKKIYEARTDVNGTAYLFHSLNGKSDNVTRVCLNEQMTALDGKTELTLTYDGKTEVKKLDLMLMVDTTGSMGDELRYLQTELKDVINKVAKDEVLSIRVSVNFYRDEGDEYIVREFNFTDDIAKAINQLADQEANGGGDYPEAVHQALENIENHQWRNDAVKLCFFVLDAPPHTESEIQGINDLMTNTVAKMAKQGIRLIPVASSGVNTETELLLRSWAAMTGGTYTFLTNHSGVGNDHLEPTIGEYQVEKLNNLMVRLIREYCGLKTTTQQ